MMSASTTPVDIGEVAVKVRKFQCGTCSKAFTKSEHLARHERSHKKHRPFSCTHCNKSFGRQDVLSRHTKQLHDKSSGVDEAFLPDYSASTPDFSCRRRVSSCSPPRAEFHGPDLVGRIHTTSNEAATQLNMGVAIDQHLPWSGGDMLELLMSDFNNNWPVPLPVVPAPIRGAQNATQSSMTGQIANIAASPGQQAMQQMSRLISDLSFNLMAEVESIGITSAFLDTCMHVFFDKFIPSFPVMHKPTFSPRDCSNPLLLKIFALGSLFIGAKDAIRKGEALWRLAHTAVATSWQALLAVRGPRDDCNGVQLVLTALFGQIYAMLSKNESLRMTSQTFHGLGFYWARQCGMYNKHEISDEDVPSLQANETVKIEKWKTWAAREVSNRAVLGHYVLDGQISQYSGYVACARHVVNPLLVPESDTAYAANTPDAWIIEMQKPRPPRRSLREIFVSVFSPGQLPTDLSPSNFSIRLIMEGLQSLASDMQEASGPAVGTPSSLSIVRALVSLHNDYLNIHRPSSVENMELLLIRWHSICLSIATPSSILCKKLCALHGVQQQLFADSNTNTSVAGFDVRKWSQSVEGRRALLHAIAIQDTVEKLPLRRSHAIHLPWAIFSAATIYSAHCLASLPDVVVPIQIRWQDVWELDMSDTNADNFSPHGRGVKEFLDGSLSAEAKYSTTRNLLYDLNSAQIMLNSISSRWGVSNEMDQIIQQWMNIANESYQSTI